MGKRKYEDNLNNENKKSKSENNSENVVDSENDAEQPQNEQNIQAESRNIDKNALFDIKHFRKELTARQGQTMALTQFLQVCLNPDSDVDYMLEYLKVGGNSHELLRQINQDNRKNLTLATPVFHLFHLNILKVQSSLPHMISISEEACRYFLNTFSSTVEIMISENSGPRHRKIILDLLTSMVTLNSDLGVEILNQIPLTPKNLQYILEKPNYKMKDNVRTSFVRFMTSFLIDGNLPLMKALLEKQGLLVLVIPGLVQDEPEAVLMFLNILKKHVIDNTLISKTLKLKTFSHQVLHNMFKVFMWKGPPESELDKGEFKAEIMKLLSDIMLTLFTSHKLGIYFVDNFVGTSDINKNQNLYRALQLLKRPWENEYQGEVVLEIIYRCPDLHRAIINVIEQTFQPQHSPIWEKAVKFVMSLLDKLNPDIMVTRLHHLNVTQTVNFVRFITLPVPLLKLMNDEIGKDPTVSAYCFKVLVKMLQTLKRFMQILESEDSNAKIAELKNKLDNFLPKHMPTPNIVVSLIKKIIESNGGTETVQDYRLPTLDTAEALLTLIDTLLLYHSIYPSSFESLEGTIDMKRLLEFSTTLTTGSTSLLKFKIVSLWLTLDGSALTIKNPMFKQLFLIMLDVFTSEKDQTWSEAKDTLYIFLQNTEIFEADEDEIDLMLYTLRNSKVNPISLMADVIEHVLANAKELSEYVRNQAVNFEITDESSKEKLDQLFKDLMHGKQSAESVFLESKIPSPFIVGCVQFIQNNRDAKKNLKQFLCLYVANLLHCNISPELTEVLIGDSKLDVRSYVADWTIQPVVIPDSISRDDTLKNLSKAIIEGVDIPVTDIFTFLLEAEEEYDVRIFDVGYKIDITKSINGSDLFVWSKYLMFCVIRLSNMRCLNREQQKKIDSFFQVIIKAGRKRLMLNVCRNIILNLFKNAHFLKVYQPVDFDKNPSNILATEFLLQIVECNEDIINYLDKKHNILKSYQQKTFNEIKKALIKVNKRKSINGDLTVRVLEIIGLSKENDLELLNNILSASIFACFRDDKEPTFILQLLRVLIQKYSKSIAQELPQDTISNSICLYMKLLNLKDVTPNLSELEESLIQLFENKPHYTLCVSEQEFRKFFNANVIRKSTSSLAALLLKFQFKMCNIFVEEIIRPEILSQREITLPLGNAMMNHAQFVAGNKTVLFKIFEEYKSNINKFLEKPHKAGQVYINSWKLIKKLITECMDVKDCKKLFAKSHKFETVEPSHVNLFQITFMKLCLEKLDKEHLMNYLLSMLNIISLAIRDNKEPDLLSDLILKVNNVIRLVQNGENVDIKKKDDFQKITKNAIWQSFCKSVLKDSLKIRTADHENETGPQLLALLSYLIKLLYSEDHEDIVTIFDMVTSHSEFLNVMLSLHSPDIKSRLLELLFFLISINRSVMKTQQIPVYLSAYRATRDHSDRLILSILQFYESNDMPVNEYKPYIFGESAANHYAVRKKRTASLWGHPTPNQVMNLFDKDLIERTIKHFPVNQTLDYRYELPNIDPTGCTLKECLRRIRKDGHETDDTESAIKMLLKKDEYNQILSKAKEHDINSVSHVKEDECIYDPAFLFPLLSHILAPGSAASCFKMLRTGLLSVPVMGLSSHCPSMRAAAYHVLHRFCMLLETETRHKNDKVLLKDFITTLRQSLSSAISMKADEGQLKDIQNPRLPAIGALYLARALAVSTMPADPLYRPVNNFLIAKQLVDLRVVPDFLSLFHDSEIEAIDRRLWILDVIQDGTKTIIDVVVVFKTMCLKMIMDFYSTVLCDKRTKVKIINAVSAMVAVPWAFEILTEGYGLMPWLHCVVRNTDDKSIAVAIIALVTNMLHSMEISLLMKHTKFNRSTDLSNFKVKSEVEFGILGLVYKLLTRVRRLDGDELISYVKLYNLITKRSVKFLATKQIIDIVIGCTSHLKDDERVNILKRSLDANNSLLLCSKDLTSRSNSSEDILINELKELVQTYIS